jgi:hypothetical protein
MDASYQLEFETAMQDTWDLQVQPVWACKIEDIRSPNYSQT